MRGFLFGLSISVVFMVGTIAADLGMTAAAADKYSGERWEYKCTTYSESQGSLRDQRLAEAGKLGWELVSAAPLGQQNANPRALYCLKRPLS